MELKKVCPLCKEEISIKDEQCSVCGYDFAPKVEKEISEDSDMKDIGEHAPILMEEPVSFKKRVSDEERAVPIEQRPEDKGDSNYEQQTGWEDFDETSEDKFDVVKEKCQHYMKRRHKIYGLFGYAEAGKTSFLYSLRHQFEQGATGFGGYLHQGDKWDELKNVVESQWGRIAKGTPRGKIYPYSAISRDNKHIVLLDISGENFEHISSWSDEMTDFVGTYLPYCSGYFILFDMSLDLGFKLNTQSLRRKSVPEDILSGLKKMERQVYTSEDNFMEALKQAIGEKGRDTYKSLILEDADMKLKYISRSDLSKSANQMKKIAEFLSVAATTRKLKYIKDPGEKKKRMLDAQREIGKQKVDVPVALCLSKADLIEDYYFEEFGKKIPLNVRPWDVVRECWPEHYNTLLGVAPHLKIEWLSSLGRNFKQNNQIGNPMGLKSVFDFVVMNPPPPWAMSARAYLRFLKPFSKKRR